MAFAPSVSPAIPGNLPTGIRSQVRNPDGSVSTVRTISIGTDGGEVVIPTVVGGKVLSNDAAIAHYRQTGENFGTFRSVDDANAFAQALHEYHARLLQAKPQPAGGDAYNLFKRAIIGQETGGRYGVPNAQGSGARGIGQVMPDTGRVLAARLGRAWRPDLMAGTSPEAREYQDAITDAATREAWGAGGGGRDLRTSAMYYYGGSDRSQWGPKTRAYGDDIMERLRALRGY